MSTSATDATPWKVAFSVFGVSPVRSVTSRRNAASVGMNAVTRFLPWVRTPTGLSGFAFSTVRTAFSTMSKSRQLWSSFVPSAARTLARLFVPALLALPLSAAVAARGGDQTQRQQGGEGGGGAELLHGGSSLVVWVSCHDAVGRWASYDARSTEVTECWGSPSSASRLTSTAV